MTTLPTPQQLVISGLKYFLRMNEKVQVGEPLARISSPTDTSLDRPREPDGICFYLKVNLWWHELPYWNRSEEQTKLINKTEGLIDRLIKPYIPKGECYLPEKGILTAERLQVVRQLLSKLQGQ